MKKLAILILMLLSMTSYAQRYETLSNSPYTQWGHSWNAFISYPPDYKDSVNKTYPVIIYYHGAGEGGTDVNKLINAYLPGRIKNGWDAQGKTPDGKTQYFIVIAAQDPGSVTPWPASFDWWITNLQKTKKAKS